MGGMSKDDDVRKGVVRRSITTKNGKEYNKAPKIQRLVTPQRLQRKRHMVALKAKRSLKNKTETASTFRCSLSASVRPRRPVTLCWPSAAAAPTARTSKLVPLEGAIDRRRDDECHYWGTNKLALG